MQRINLKVAIATLALACFGTGCAAPIVTMSSHTLAKPDSSQDVLWIRDGHNRLQRCTLEGAAPVCRLANVAR